MSARKLHPLAKVDWKKVDWTQTNTAIAKACTVSPSHVSNMRCRFAPKTRHHEWGGGIDWKSIDWRRTNRAIAELTGKTEKAISKWRHFKAPETVWFRRYRWCDSHKKMCPVDRESGQLICDKKLENTTAEPIRQFSI